MVFREGGTMDGAVVEDEEGQSQKSYSGFRDVGFAGGHQTLASA